MRNKSAKEIPAIRLTGQNMPVFGFARFIYPDELSEQGETISRRILLTAGSQHEEKWAEIIIDRRDLILLEPKKEQTLPQKSGFSIKTAFKDVEPIKFLSERAGWNQSLDDLVQFTGLDPAGNFLAGFDDGKHFIPLGTGTVFPVGTDLSWISMILVHPEVRRQGIASIIMKQCITYARLASGKPVVGLDATPEGKQVYDNLGFRDSYRLWRCRVSLIDKMFSISGSIDPEPIRDLDEVESFLSRAGYLNRRPVLEILVKLPNAVSYAARADKVVQGVVFSRPGRRHPSIGPLLAVNKTVAAALLLKTLGHWAKMGSDQVFIDIPDQQLDLSPHIQESGDLLGISLEDTFLPGCKVSLVRPFIRMYQLIDPVTHQENDPDFNKNEDLHGAFKATLKKSTDCFDATIKSMKIENEITMPLLYAIGGPEIG